MDTHENIGKALMLTIIAGSSTGMGSAYFTKKPKMDYLVFPWAFHQV